MFSKVIVGVDSTAQGRDAIALGRGLLEAGGTLTLAHVHGGSRILGRGSESGFDTTEQARAQALVRQIRDEAGVEADIAVIGESSLGRGLHRLAEDAGADLLVVGSHHSSASGHALLSAHTRAALNGAPCAVAIAHTGCAERSPLLGDIGVAFNGTPESLHALEVARRIAAEKGATLSAFEAVSLSTSSFDGFTKPTEADIQAVVDEEIGRISALDVEGKAVYGSPVKELVSYAESKDLLVMGSRDYGPWGRLVHGSTTHDFMAVSPCSVLVLTRAARNTTQLGSLHATATS